MYSPIILRCHADTEYFLQLQRLESKSQVVTKISLRVVHLNSSELFRLHAAGHFFLWQKHCRFQLISSASDQLEVVSSFESHLLGELRAKRLGPPGGGLLDFWNRVANVK